MKKDDLLKNLIACKTVSPTNFEANKVEFTNAINILSNYFQSNGFKTKIVGQKRSLILAKRMVNNDSPTILIYGHYDVQPADGSWEIENPFFLNEVNGKYIARGIADNKGQLYINIKAVTDLIKKGDLEGVNIIFLIEGEEEISSPTLKELLKDKKFLDDLGTVDLIYISDTLKFPDQPILVSAFRGNIAFEVNIKTLVTEQHSGIYGGSLPDSNILGAKFINELDFHLKKNFKDTLTSYASSAKQTSKKMSAEIQNCLSNKSTPVDLTSASLKSALIVTGLNGGYTEEGIKNVIAASTNIKFNYRFIYKYNGDQIWQSIVEFIQKFSTEHQITIDFKLERISPAINLNINTQLSCILNAASKEVYNSEVVSKSEGASISIIESFYKNLTQNICLFGYANYDSGMHSPNENMSVEDIQKGIEFFKLFLKNFQEKYKATSDD